MRVAMAQVCRSLQTAIVECQKSTGWSASALFYRSFANKDDRPMRSLKKSASFGQRSFCAATCIKFVHRIQKSAGILRVAEEVRGFLQRLVILERKHHHRPVIFLGNDHRLMIFTNRINGLCQARPSFRVGNSVHTRCSIQSVQEVVHHGNRA
nr:hypothetical protein [uncultured bacterium]